LVVTLPIAIAIFLGSALAVIFFGSQLAKYGDALATLTGWGRLFVGSFLVAMATSLPELSTNISAVRLDPPNPELALGNVLGANMINMFTFAVVALVFGGRRFLQGVAPQRGYLIGLAVLLTGLTVVFARSSWKSNCGTLDFLQSFCWWSSWWACG
jgi:cation:H+ antiporter